MDKAIELTKALWNFCKHNWDWQDQFVKKEAPLIDHLASIPHYKPIYDDVMVSNTLYNFFRDQTFENIDAFSDEDAAELLNIILKTLEINVSTHWLTIPLNQARLSRTVNFENYFFIAGDKEAKVKIVSQLVKIDESTAESRLKHIATPAEVEFFERPLLVFSIFHQFSFVTANSQYFTLWAIYSLKAIYWGYVHSPTKSYDHVGPRIAGRKYPTDLGVHSNINFSREPFRFDAKVHLDLDWMIEKEYQEKFGEILNLSLLNQAENQLPFRFLTGLRFFGKALESERAKDYFDGYGVTFTFLMIAAETVLFKYSQQISSRLIVFLPALAKPPHFTVAECARAVKDGYNWRSNYVHNGQEVYLTSSWNQERNKFEYGSEHKTLTILKTMVGRLLSDAPGHIKNMADRRRNAQDQLDNIWFDYLNEIWEAKIGLRDLPTENQEGLV